MTLCPACGIGHLRRRHNMSRVTPEGTLSLLRCTNPDCRHHVFRLTGKDSLVPIDSNARLERFGVNVADLIFASPPVKGGEQA